MTRTTLCYGRIHRGQRVQVVRVDAKEIRLVWPKPKPEPVSDEEADSWLAANAEAAREIYDRDFASRYAHPAQLGLSLIQLRAEEVRGCRLAQHVFAARLQQGDPVRQVEAGLHLDPPLREVEPRLRVAGR